jgi:hypothetical protein
MKASEIREVASVHRLGALNAGGRFPEPEAFFEAGARWALQRVWKDANDAYMAKRLTGETLDWTDKETEVEEK